MIDLFEKCEKRMLADDIRERGLYPYFHALESRQDVEVMMEGKRRIMLGSNNYLGLTTCPEVIEAGVRAYQELGSGCSGSRFLNGTLKLHLQLEEELADFLHKDAAVTFSTGFQSNLGIISAIVGMHDYVIMDRENHASLYDGCRLSYGKMLRFMHNDMADLEKKLQKEPENCGCLIVTDGVFSMGGDIANLPEICRLAKKYGARVMVDDAHGLGVLAGGGIGIAPLYGLARRMLDTGVTPTVALGFRTAKDAFYLEEFAALGCSLSVATEDGSLGTRGFVTDCIRALPECDYVYTCGPLPMLKAVHQLPQLTGGQFSFEARMGCGFGACMGCTVPTVDGYKRVCKDGPILYKEEIVW